MSKELGPSTVRAQIAAGRWRAVSSIVVATFTGSLPAEATRWAALLNAGPSSALCGGSALEVRGLTGWSSDTVQVIVDRGANREDLDAVGVGRLAPTRWYSDLLRAADITATDETPILRLPATVARIDQELVAAILHRYLGLDRRVA